MCSPCLVFLPPHVIECSCYVSLSPGHVSRPPAYGALRSPWVVELTGCGRASYRPSVQGVDTRLAPPPNLTLSVLALLGNEQHLLQNTASSVRSSLAVDLQNQLSLLTPYTTTYTTVATSAARNMAVDKAARRGRGRRAAFSSASRCSISQPLLAYSWCA